MQTEPDDDLIVSINMTPLVDIMLVLLIIFMLVSTLLDFSVIQVDLPPAATAEDAKSRTEAIVITREGDYYLSGEKIASFKLLMETLAHKKQTEPDLRVIISADGKTYHEAIVKVIDALRKLKIYKFAINVELIDADFDN